MSKKVGENGGGWENGEVKFETRIFFIEVAAGDGGSSEPWVFNSQRRLDDLCCLRNDADRWWQGKFLE